MALFGKSAGWLSAVFNDAVTFLVEEFTPLLQWHPQLTYSRLQVYADAVEEVGGYRGIWGFVDGTFRGFCKPSKGDEAQRAVYNGHKRQHGQVWQAVVTPDGLVSSLVGPFLGPTNDWTMWRRSGCEEAARSSMGCHEVLYLYGDPAYRCSYGVMPPFTHPRGRRYLSREKQDFNRSLATVRIAVENAFGQTQQLWTYTAFSKGLSANKQLVAAYFAVAILLSDCHTCIRGNSISKRFLVTPPLVESYLFI